MIAQGCLLSVEFPSGIKVAAHSLSVLPFVAHMVAAKCSIPIRLSDLLGEKTSGIEMTSCAEKTSGDEKNSSDEKTSGPEIASSIENTSSDAMSSGIETSSDEKSSGAAM